MKFDNGKTGHVANALSIACVVTILVVCAASRAEDDPGIPKELMNARRIYSQQFNAEKAKYDKMFENAIAPLRNRYIKHLEMLKNRFVRENDLVSAASVQNEIDKLSVESGGIFALIVWNQHNSTANDRGTRRYDISLYDDEALVWERKNVKLDWKAGADIKSETKLPGVGFDRVRITITEWEGRGGGLAEVQLVCNGINVAESAVVSASAASDRRTPPEAVIDGVTSSDTPGNFWLMPDNQSGWIELKDWHK